MAPSLYRRSLFGLLALSLILPITGPAFAGPKEHVRPLKFPKGRIATVVSGAVIRAEVDTYTFSARTGQHLTTAIASWENNAVFEISYRKQGQWRALANARSWNGTLPRSEGHRYKISVSGTRGNATYQLFVGISVTKR